MSAATWRRITLAVVGFAFANGLYSAWHQGWTYDEPFHLEWTERLLTSRNAQRDIAHYNSKTPVMLPNVLADLAARRAQASEPERRFASRLPSLVWLAALLATVFALGRRLFGEPAAYLATTAAALDSNLVAHGSLATVDVAYALGTLLTVAAAAAFGARPSPGLAAALGLALGFALTVKFSAILLLPTLLLLPLLARPARRDWPRWLVGGLLVAAVAALFVCAAYLFLDVATPLGSRHWLSHPMRRLASALPWLRLPLPVAFLTGYDVSLAAERGDWNVVILSRWYPQGVWFYFAVLWLLKTPLLVLLAETWGLARAARGRLGDGALGAKLLLATLLVHLGYFSLIFRTQVGFRFVLMCVPIAYLLAAAGLAQLATGRRAAVAVVAVVALASVENGMYFGNPLSFTNAAVWPKKQAFRLIADSNLDWGQHDAQMEAWSHRPGVRTHFNPLHLLPGHNTFSVNEVAGVSEFERHRFLRENADPVGHIDHTHVWFEVDDALFDRFMNEQRRLAPRAGDATCPATLSYEPLSAASPVHLFLEGIASGSRTWLVCVVTAGGADLGLRASRGRTVLAPHADGKACEGEFVEEGQEAWYRLSPGRHALCVAEAPGRDGAPHPFDGSWVVRSGDAALARSAAPAVDAPSRPR